MTLKAATDRKIRHIPGFDQDIDLYIPTDDEPDPELSIVIPALNEESNISEFISWCKEGLRRAEISGEILIVDSSTDSTPDLALAGGARVLRTPKRGLGLAYIDSIPYVRGKVCPDGRCRR